MRRFAALYGHQEVVKKRENIWPPMIIWHLDLGIKLTTLRIQETIGKLCFHWGRQHIMPSHWLQYPQALTLTFKWYENPAKVWDGWLRLRCVTAAGDCKNFVFHGILGLVWCVQTRLDCLWHTFLYEGWSVSQRQTETNALFWSQVTPLSPLLMLSEKGTSCESLLGKSLLKGE